MNDNEQDVAPERVEAIIDAPDQNTPDADDSQTDDAHDSVEAIRLDLDAAKLGEAITKAATDTAYATVGLVGLLSDRVKEYYEQQKKQYAQDHPDLEEEPNATHLLSQFGEQLDRFVGDIGRTFQDLVERGRAGSTQAPVSDDEATPEAVPETAPEGEDGPVQE